jgi:PAS domain S-box-containing protein
MATKPTYQELEQRIKELERKDLARIRALEALETGEFLYSLAQRAANMGSWHWNITSGDLTWSEMIEPMFGFGLGQFEGTYEAFLDRVHPEDRQRVIDAVNATLTQGMDYAIEHRIVWPDGSVRWVSEKGAVIRDKKGKAVRMLGVVQDITESKDAQTALRESEIRYSTLARASFEGILIHDKGAIIDANSRLAEMFQYNADELIGKNALDFIDPRFRHVVNDAVAQGLEKPYEVLGRKKDGSTVPLEIQARHMQCGNRILRVAAIRDISNRKKAETRITKAKREWEQTFDAVPDLITIIDMEYRILRANKSAALRLGRLPQDLVGRLCYEAFHETEEPPLFCPHKKYSLQGKDGFAEVHETRLGGDFLVSVSPLVGDDGTQWGVVHVARDVTRQRQAEKALRKAHEELEKRVQERTAQLGQLSSKLLNAQEDERKRISRELHDSIGQSLAAVKVVAESALSQIRQGEINAGGKTVATLIPLIRDASEEVRRIYTDLRPSLLDDLGIITTISWFCREFQNVFPGITIQKRIAIKEENVPEALKIVIFRVLQEAMNNASKHSKADLVQIGLGDKGSHLELSVKDNGRGFDVPHPVSSETADRGFGLQSMKERVELTGGTLILESASGAGTIVRASWQV